MALGMRLFLGAAADEGGAAAGDSSIVAVIVVQFQFLCTRVNAWARGVQRDHAYEVTYIRNKSRCRWNKMSTMKLVARRRTAIMLGMKIYERIT